MVQLSIYGEQLNTKSPLQEYPRMQLQRDSYLNLNGIWEYQIVGKDEEPRYDRWQQIVVPFALGSYLSGTNETLDENHTLWYRKQFAYKPTSLSTWLNFEAVDQECVVYVNGVEVGQHSGGYAPFSLDISGTIKYQNSLMVKVNDPSDKGIYAYGKQRLNHSGMWYTPSSGIWQSVWIEDIPKHAIYDLKITPDYDKGVVLIDMAGNFSQAAITIGGSGEVVHRGLTTQKHYEAPIPNMHAWTPEDPYLYDIYIQTEDDIVKSYFGMRKFSVGTDAKGITRFMLNNRPYFFSGLLDQGYISDGLMTFPSDQAMIDEILKVKELGFNMIRKHIKVEARRWYYHCDRLGILVMQDMPSGGQFDFKNMGVLPTIGMRRMSDIDNDKLGRSTLEEKKAYYHELDEMLDNLYNCVSLFAWVPFNEGWGQFNSEQITAHIKEYDDTRLVDSASGWHDQGCGDFFSMHNYFFHYKQKKDKYNRICVLSEFGGYAYIEEGHNSANKLYGYKKYTDKLKYNEELFALYEEAILKNIDKGLSGCIYTQLSDVEDECNGIFTMDRKVIKVDARKMKRMNEKLYRRMTR